MTAELTREPHRYRRIGIVIALIFALYQIRQAYRSGRNARPTQQVVII